MIGTYSCRARSWLPGILAALTLAASGCGILDVEDPTKIQESAVQNRDGAEMLRLSALRSFAMLATYSAVSTGLMSDELIFERPSWQAPLSSADEFMDRRQNHEVESAGGAFYSMWPSARLAISMAMGPIKGYSVIEHAGELYAIRGFNSLKLAENFCPGFPINHAVDERVVLGEPLTTDEAFAVALADFDSALALAGDSANILNLARVGKGRALLNLGRFDEAATAVAAVPVEFTYAMEYNAAVTANILGGDHYSWMPGFGPMRSVANQEGGNGLDFVSANDPRVVVPANGTSLDGVTPLYKIGKYPDRNTSLVIASGIDARLIGAEAALHAGDANWLQILKDLRLSSAAPAGLAPLTDDPTTQVAKENLLFRERAFWLFATGTRLADLRRLVRLYGRTTESVFPTGAYRYGGQYGTSSTLPFDSANESSYNPAVTGCLSD